MCGECVWVSKWASQLKTILVAKWVVTHVYGNKVILAVNYISGYSVPFYIFWYHSVLRNTVAAFDFP